MSMIVSLIHRKITPLYLVLSLTAFLLAGCDRSTGTMNVTVVPTGIFPEELAFQHLEEVMDRFHETFDVYTDLSSAGNHFVTLGRMSSSGDGDKVRMNSDSTSNCFSGVTCIVNRFYSSGNNWGGWYFMNGILEGEETQPKPNWGEYPDAGIDLTGATNLTFWARGERGGERVEFFALGVGRDPVTGNSVKPYPDYSPKVSLGYVTLSNTWTQYIIDLTGKDLSYVLGGFGWVTNAPENNNQDITFYVDDIKYHKSHLDNPRFLVSYETTPSSLDFDTIMKNVAFTYDNALILIAILSRGRVEDMERARLLADAFVYAINNDRYFTDGRLRNAYQGGDLVLSPGWRPNGKENTVRMPGWWDPKDNMWYEDRYHVSTDTGNLAWAMIALLSYYEKVGGSQYLEAAKTLGEWIERETKDTRGTGGYTGGYRGWEVTGNNPEGQTKMQWKSTEHNIDVYVAFSRLYEATGDTTWKDRALYARAFVESMWDEGEGHFWAGTFEDGKTINRSNIPLDVNTWGLMALGDISKYGKGIDWVENNCYVEAEGFKGFDFNNDRDHIWFEGTAHMVLAYQITGDTAKTDAYLSELERVQTYAPNSSGKGIVAASYDGLTTGFDWLYYNRLHIGATAWFIFAERGYNPYWGIKTTDTIPVYEVEPLNVSYSYNDFALTKVCTYEDNWCSYADRPGKAVIYGEMSKDIEAQPLYKKLDVTISIPCNGWGEGLAGPDGSSAHIIVDNVIKEEIIDDTMPYHHGGYYRYEYCDSFTNTFDIAGKTQIQLIIRMNGGARLDFQEAKLKFY